MVSPRKMMAMGKKPAIGKRVSADLNKNKVIDGSGKTREKRSKRVQKSPRRSMLTSHTKNAKAMGASYISKGTTNPCLDSMKYL
jgi:hypothetical protein